jgi:hypothetical protein
MRDYTDMLNMVPAELVAHALECAKVGIVLIALVEALALQLATEATQAARLLEDLEDAERRVYDWQEEAKALQFQLSRTYG